MYNRSCQIDLLASFELHTKPCFPGCTKIKSGALPKNKSRAGRKKITTIIHTKLLSVTFGLAAGDACGESLKIWTDRKPATCCP